MHTELWNHCLCCFLVECVIVLLSLIVFILLKSKLFVSETGFYHVYNVDQLLIVASDISEEHSLSFSMLGTTVVSCFLISFLKERDWKRGTVSITT